MISDHRTRLRSTIGFALTRRLFHGGEVSSSAPVFVRVNQVHHIHSRHLAQGENRATAL